MEGQSLYVFYGLPFLDQLFGFYGVGDSTSSFLWGVASPLMGLMGMWPRIDKRDENEEELFGRLIGAIGIVGSLSALGGMIVFSETNLSIPIILIGQLVGGVSCIINGSSKSGAAIKYFIASISYLIILAAILQVDFSIITFRKS